MAIAISERQQSEDGFLKAWPSEYQYLGPHNGLYAFVCPDTGKADLFARRKTAPAGWHLVRGAYFYEFCRSMPN